MLQTPAYANGAHTISVRATDSYNQVSSTTVSVTFSNSPFQIWLAANFTPYQLTVSTISGPNAAPAGDGVPNLEKYALYMNPWVASTVGLPTGAIINNHLVMSYTQVAAATDITYTTLKSAGLVGPWTSAGVTQIASTVYPATSTIQMQDPDLVNATPLGFMQLQLTYTPSGVGGGHAISLAASARIGASLSANASSGAPYQTTQTQIQEDPPAPTTPVRLPTTGVAGGSVGGVAVSAVADLNWAVPQSGVVGSPAIPASSSPVLPNGNVQVPMTSLPALSVSKHAAIALVGPQGGAIHAKDGSGVVVPQGATSSLLSVTVSPAPTAIVTAGQSSAEAAQGLAPAAAGVQFGPEGTQFAKPVTIALPYNRTQLPEGFQESALTINYWNSATSAWQTLASVVDTVNQVVSAQTSHFSLYQLMVGSGTVKGIVSAAAGTVADVQIACNPIRPNCAPMRFQNLPAGARLRVYTLSGVLIKDFSTDANGLASWDGTNQNGASVATGIYMIYAQGAGTSKTFKVAVQR